MRITIGGQVEKDSLAALVKKLGGDSVEVTIKNDIEAAMSVKNGSSDYYLGACHTGGGGALAMAIALLGMGACTTLSMPGNIRRDDEIIAEVKAGKKAFGFTAQHIDQVAPVLIRALLDKELSDR
jgi:hypothetical protein